MILTIAARLLGSAIALIVGLGTIQHAAAQIVAGQVDNFETSLDGWTSGANNPTPPARIPDAGPGGAGDDVMRLTSSGSPGAGHGLVVMNTDQWRGNYITAGLSSISFDVANLGPTDLSLRLAFNSADGSTWFVTTQAVLSPSASGWQHAQLSLAELNLTRVQGVQDYGTVFGNVSEVRLLHSTGVGYKGDPITSVLDVDNITAVPEPAASACVLAVSVLLVAVCLRRHKALSQSHAVT